MTRSELSLRLAKRSEAATIAAMSRTWIEYGLRWAWRAERVAGRIRDRNAHVLVACVGEEIAGFAIMRYGEDTARLELFGVAPRHRRLGVGRRLLEWLEKCALVAGIAEILLEVRAGNEGAQAFYQRMGYRRHAYLAGYYEGSEAAIRMRREFLPAKPGDGFEFRWSPAAGDRRASRS